MVKKSFRESGINIRRSFDFMYALVIYFISITRISVISI